MAEGYLRSLNKGLSVFSAGTKPEKEVNPIAIRVMSEIGIDISSHIPELVDNYVNEQFDYVITVCGNAKENCPVFTGNVKHRLHIGFEDPAKAIGTEDEVLKKYREIRDLIIKDFKELYDNDISVDL